MRLLLLFTIFSFIEAPKALDDEKWQHNTHYAEHIATYIKEDRFDLHFQTSTVEQINHTLRTLKKGLSFLRGERFSNAILGYSWTNQSWQIRLFKSKIKELKEKRKNLKKQKETLKEQKRKLKEQERTKSLYNEIYADPNFKKITNLIIPSQLVFGTHEIEEEEIQKEELQNLENFLDTLKTSTPEEIDYTLRILDRSQNRAAVNSSSGYFPEYSKRYARLFRKKISELREKRSHLCQNTFAPN